MVTGLKTKDTKNPHVLLDYIINLIEIKPWPPSHSLRSLRSALIQWEHGDKNSGSTKAVAPSIVSGSGIGDGKIEFNESFRVHVTLSRDMSIKSGDNETFIRNCIEFNMYEPRRDKTVKGQLLATAVIDFAEYGIIQDNLMICVPMNCKRNFGNKAQPMLFVKIQIIEKNIRSESLSALMNEEYAEEAETATSTDDDIPSQSSMAAVSLTFESNGNSTPQKENGYETICGSSGKVNDEVSVQDKRADESFYEERMLSSKDLYSEIQNARTTLSNLRNSRFTKLSQMTESYSIKLSNERESQSRGKNQIIGDFQSDTDKLKNLKHLNSSLDSGFSIGSVRTSKLTEKFKNFGVYDQNSVSKVQHLEQRVKVLEGELRESAGIEVSLYSVVAEHGSSINKVHAPARRLYRLYLHACKQNSLRKASSARSIVSGLILVAKACGNDVPRLTFWLSNTIVLRAIIHKTCKKDSSLKESRTSNEWEDPLMVTSVLEKVESWIFSRIIEFIWWQTFAPYMQSTAAKGIIRVLDSESNKSCQTSGSLNHKQVNTSLELWKTAFMDACERICPVRAAGHDCGCLSVLSKLIMEQCTGRLDVAMFNAILRESEDEVPTDPVSDPISDSRVLPIPSGKASFGAGAQLKKTIGNWSRWLTDLVGIDNNDNDVSFNSFHLLSALSELMMLPKDMVLSNTIRKEVCPTFGVPLIKKILDSFIPDEFCPDPIPDVVLEVLDSEDLIESGEDCVTSLPCAAAPIAYHTPCALSLIECILGDDGTRAHLSHSRSSILQKSNTSDDELDEFDSSLTSIIDFDSSRTVTKPVWTLKDASCRNTIRYQLLREVWMNSD